MSRFRRAAVALALALPVVPVALARAQDRPSPLGVEQALRALVSPAASGERSAGAPAPATVDAAGLTRAGRRLWAVEATGGGEASRPKLVLVGGLDGNVASTEAVIRVAGWWLSAQDAQGLRAEWTLAALPCARPELCDAAPSPASDAPSLVFPPTGGFFDGKQEPTPHAIWRWTTMQAPTVVIEVRAGGEVRWRANALATSVVPGAGPAEAGTLAGALGSAGSGAAWSAPAPALQLDALPDAAVEAVRDVLARAAGVTSPLRGTILARQSRTPLAIARLLAPKYPAQPIMSYIPALAWSGALRLARMTGEGRFREKPLADMAPFLSGAKPSIAEPYLLTSLAGHLALSDLGEIDGNPAANALARKAADFILPEAPGEIVRFARAWTDDMFMATSVLARVAAREKDGERYAAAAGRLLTSYAADLQQPDGLFIHAKAGPHAWGRGNGFAAFGLMEALTHLPAAWPDRARVLQGYQALMKGLLAQQAADGMWRQVVDEPGSYRELTVTAMVLTAMARGVRLGWLDGSYRPVVDRAWRGLLARIAEDGTLMDVCTGTGAGSTRQYYLERAAITGADDRGGAMALAAAVEMEGLNRVH